MCISFIIHGLFPFIPVPKKLNLEGFSNWLLFENKDLEARKKWISESRKLWVKFVKKDKEEKKLQ